VPAGLSESTVEAAALEWFRELGYATRHGREIAPGAEASERGSYADAALVGRLRAAVARINPGVPEEAREEALRRALRRDLPALIANNHAFHRLLVDGVSVEYRGDDGRVVPDLVWLVDFDRPEHNDWLVVNQLTVTDGAHTRRPDLVVFVNGLPVAVFELKDPTDEDADIWAAFTQLQTYKAEIPSLLAFNEVLVISDGTYTRVGALSADRERFLPWRTVEGDAPADPGLSELQVVIQGVFAPARLLELVRSFVVFESEGGGEPIKKLAAYHQVHAVRRAVAQTVRAASAGGDRRVGVVWHTQGSGKSLTMAFYAGRLAVEPALANPTLVVITDRNDLDDQLFTAFSRCWELLRQQPEQAEDRADLRKRLGMRPSGGVIFTTIQKFAPPASAASAWA
jgi:type I restriction enzyme R subunit